MPSLIARASVIAAALVLLSGQAPPAGFERVDIKAKDVTIHGYLKRPEPPRLATGAKGQDASAGPPVVIAVHGCGGLFAQSGAMARREVDWAERLAGWGYAALFIDSFNPRGFRQVCTVAAAERPVTPLERAGDVMAALAWIAGEPSLDKSRVAMIGWSHGGSTTLWSVDHRRRGAAQLKTAIAFYPGCRVPSESERWAPGLPLTILMGAADDWTPPAPCRALVSKHPAVRYIEYPDAVHGFDAPSSPRRTLTNLAIVGQAQVGTDPAARAAAIAEVERILKDALN